MKCTHCDTVRESKADRLPPKWKRLPGSTDPCCAKCWGERYMLRAVTLPIKGPDVDGNPTEMEAAWKSLRERLRTAWGLSTQLANWSVQQLQKADIVRDSTMIKRDKDAQPILRDGKPIPAIPPIPKEIYLYGLFGKYVDRAQWDGAAASAQSLMRTVEACWRESRLDVLWHYNASARTYRWPMPFPVHNDSWSVKRTDAGVWSCSLQLPGGRISLRVRNDRTRGHQFARLKQLADGTAVAGEAAIYARIVQGRDDRNGITLIGPGGKETYRVLLKLAG